MKKIHIYILLNIALVGLAAYFVYKNFYQPRLDIWELVPGNAVMVYENNNTVESWNSIVSKPVWQTLRQIPRFADYENTVNELDSLTGKDGTIDKLFRNKSFLISTEIVSSDGFDFTFYLDLEGSGNDMFSKILQSLKKSYHYTLKKREFMKFQIQELVNRSSNKTFTFLIYKNYLIGSYTPFLVEDVIRNIQEKFKDNFQQHITSLNDISKLENDEGNLYLDISKLPKLGGVFLNPESGKQLSRLATFAGNTFLDIKFTDHEILFNGVSTQAVSAKPDFINTFHNQNAQQVNITQYLPQRTAVFYDLAFSDFKNWQIAQTKYWAVNDRKQLDRYRTFDNNAGLSLDWIDDEIGIATLETIEPDVPDKLMLIKAKNAGEAMDSLTAYTQRIVAQSGDSLYSESFMDQQIIQLPVIEFPEQFLGSSFHGFENSYFTSYGDYIVLGNKMQVVKYFLKEIDDENTWGKSVKQNLFLENTLGESSISLMVNTPMFWDFLYEQLNDKWKTIFRQYHNQMKAFDMLAFQVSNLDNRYYTSLDVEHHTVTVKPEFASRFKKIQSAYTLTPIVTKPFIVRNHNNNRFEVMVQDSLNILYLISNEGEILWGDSIGSRITTDIAQVDYYKNKKLQYVFATKHRIFLLDRNGDHVADFPLKPDKNINVEYLSVIDYDNSKRYRFMFADDQGNLYLYDKDKKNLEGWQPRKLGGALACAPFHVRVRGGDCMIALQKNGVLNVMNRRGEMYNGFPIKLETPISGPIFTDIGNDFSTTKLIVVSETGEVIQVNLQGKILSREQLYKTTKESKFWLVPDALGQTFVIARQDYGRLSILNRSGASILESNLVTSSHLELQYYNFSTDNQIFVVVDPEQEFTYIYDQDGKLLNFEPIESGLPIALIYLTRERAFHLYKCYGNSFSVLSFE